jgi:DNA-binding Lrp family transcriptional regulator
MYLSSHRTRMKLSEKEATVLAASELRAQAPIAVLKKESGYKEHIIRHALRRLREREVIHPIPVINLHRIGFSVYNIFFSSSAQGKTARQQIVRSLVSSPEAMWVGEFGGEYHYGVAFCARRPAHVVTFLQALSRKHKDVFLEKAVSLTVSSTLFPRKYLSGRRMTIEPVTVTFSDTIVEVDELDMNILSALSTFGDLSHRQLASKVQVPLSTLELRIRKLRERKVIVGDIYVVSPDHFDRQSFKLLVYTKGLDPELSKRMHIFCNQHRDIVYLFECVGVWGFEVGVEVARAEDVSSVMHEIYEYFGPAVNNIKLLTKFRYPKVRWFPG